MSTSPPEHAPASLDVHAEAFAVFLAERGYRASGIDEYLSRLGRLSSWLCGTGRDVSDLSATEVELFAAGEPSAWTGHRARPYRVVAEYLRSAGALSPEKPDAGPAAWLLDDYRRWLSSERSLAELTVKGYLATAAWFVEECCSNDPERVRALSPADVAAVVLRLGRGYSARTVNELVVRLRSFFRYLHTAGVVERPLANAVPWMAHSRAGSLPRGVPSGVAERLLRTCDLDSHVGRRDFAVLKVIIRLGLRRGEVAAISLEDLDWRSGELEVPGKGGFRDPLPLPADVGEAITSYLEVRGRMPRCRSLFCHVRVPRGPITPSDVSAIVQRACSRADVADTGTHRLRHALATDLLARGASLPEIGQVLRHRALQTTAIYAKVDRAALGELARPWPGSEK